MPEAPRSLTAEELQAKMAGTEEVINSTDEIDAAMGWDSAPAEPEPGGILSTEEVDQLLGELAPEEDARLKNITPERIADEWGQLTDTARSVVMNASDLKFKEITEKYKHIPDTQRKTNIMIIMRRLIKSNDPLASKITGRQEGRMQEAA